MDLKQVALPQRMRGVLWSQKWLTQEGRHTLAKLVVKLFMPALLFDKLGQHVSFQEAVELWPIAVNVCAW